MEKLKITIIIIIISIFLIILYIYYKDQKQNICNYNPGTGKPFPPTWSRPDCIFLSELKTDDIEQGPNVFLANFSYSDGAGPAICKNMWYASRWVRESDGAYGPLSPWTSLPIKSGAKKFPCIPGGCSFENSNTTNFNAPQLATVQPLSYSINDGYYLNLHRYVHTKPPKEDEEGEIVGVLYPTNSNFYTSSWLDVLYNPKTC